MLTTIISPVATVLVMRGCLKPGTHIISGKTQAKTRVLMNSLGKSVKSAYPGDAVTVSGWKEVPSAGDEVLSGTESDIKKAVVNRVRKAEQDAALVDLEAINASRRAERERREADEATKDADRRADRVVEPEGPKELRLVIKGDVSGSVEAVAGALEGIGNNLARVKIISTGVGDITESDVQMAQTANGA
jgi:translation initiation factor IF-2